MQVVKVNKPKVAALTAIVTQLESISLVKTCSKRTTDNALPNEFSA